MKMTNQMKQDFVEAVLADVPTTDYEEQIRDYVLKVAVEALPPAVRALWDNTALRGYVNTGHYSDFNLHPGVGVFVPCADDYNVEVKLTPDQREHIARLQRKREAQNEMLRELRVKLRSTVAHITTTQQAVKLLPEFEKYVPGEAVKDRTVPAVANLMKDLVEAGWPNGGKPTEVTA